MSLNVYISADDDSAAATEHLMRYLYTKGYGVASSNQYGTDLDASRQITLAADVLIILLMPHTSASSRAHAGVKLAQSANPSIIPALIQVMLSRLCLLSSWLICVSSNTRSCCFICGGCSRLRRGLWCRRCRLV
jgi:hypothetical protein